MEAVPRLPMQWFVLKTSPEGTSFVNLKRHIAEYYQEDPESYSKDVYALETLRNSAMRPAKDVTGCAILKRYYCQLHSLINRFPRVSDAFIFTWKDLYTSNITEISDIRYEMAAVLFNIAALHTQLGANVSRTDTDGIKLACTHFQCAAWAFGELREKYQGVNNNSDFMTNELLLFMQQISFAQAQECILEKSLMDNRKSFIVAKITSQIINYYGAALVALLTGGDDGSVSDLVGGSIIKEWKKFVRFKISYLNCILFLYQGQQAEEQQKMGERVVLYQAAWDKLEEAKKESKGMPDQKEIIESLTFTADVVEAKRKAAKNENEFIYHEAVPELSEIAAVQGRNLVTGISFSVTDPEVFGEDIFARLIPMKAHEASSLYSEEKAQILRIYGSKIEEKDNELATFMSSLNVDQINASEERSTKIPQGIVDRCASLNAKTNAIPDLITSMSNLAEICADVETNLKEIKELLNEEDLNEKQYQQKSGVHRSNAHVTELSREFQKYLEAHQKAGDSNDTLRRAMELHVNNLRILSKPLPEIQQSVPKLVGDINDTTFADLKLLLNKVNEMKAQRAQFHVDLRIAVNNDDITSKIIAQGDDEDLKKFFKNELSKHDKLCTLVDQNLSAQANILTALTEAYAKYAPVLKTLADVKHKRENFFTSLAASYDVYEDLLAKSAKGLEFYKKLQGNVQKLLARVRAARDVQNEERQQRLNSSKITKPIDKNPAIQSVPAKIGQPKLKDYLKGGKPIIGQDTNYIPSIRPNPLGSETPSTSTCNTPAAPYYTNPQTSLPSDLPPPYTPPQQYPDSSGYINPIYQTNQIYNTSMKTDYTPYESQTYYQNSTYPNSTPNQPSSLSSSHQPLSQNPSQIQQYQYPATSNAENTSQQQQQQYQYPSSNSTENTSQQQQQYQYPASNSAENTSQQQQQYQYPASNSAENTSQQQQQQYQYPASNSAENVSQIQQYQYPATLNHQNAPQIQQYQYPATSNVQNTVQIQQYQYPGTNNAGFQQTSEVQSGNVSYEQQNIANQQQNMTNQQQNFQSSQQNAPSQNTTQQQSGLVPNQQSQQTGLVSNQQSQQTGLVSNQSSQHSYPQYGYSQSMYPQQTAYQQPSVQSSQTQLSMPGQTALQATSSTVWNTSGITNQMDNLSLQNSQQLNQYYTYQQQPQYVTQSQEQYVHPQSTTVVSSSVPTTTASEYNSTSYISHPGYVFNSLTGEYSYQYGSGYQVDQNVLNNIYSQYTTAIPMQDSNTTDSSNVSTLGQTYATQYIEQQQQLQQVPQQVQIVDNTNSQAISNMSYYTLPYGYHSGETTANETNLPINYQQQPTQTSTHPSAATYMFSNNNNTTQTTISSGYADYLPPNENEPTIESQVQNPPQPNQVQQQQQQQTNSTTNKTVKKSTTTKKSSNIDLLSDIDFSISSPILNTPTLQPQIAASTPKSESETGSSHILSPQSINQCEIKKENLLPPTTPESTNKILDSITSDSDIKIDTTTSIDRKPSCDNISICSDLSSLDHSFDWDSVSLRNEQTQNINQQEKITADQISNIKFKDPFNDMKVLKYFHKEVERYEKMFESLNIKMLNGNTPLVNKWKDLQNLLVKDETKRSTSIGKLFPEKNRSTDCIPYDHARVVLARNTDDYINAAYVKDLGAGCPTFILAQTPLQNTVNDFWSMIWSQKARTVVCLHTPNEILDTFWPQEFNKEVHFDDFSVTLVKQFDLSHCIELNLKLTMNGADAILDLSLIQIKAWTKSAPTQILGIAQNILVAHKQRSQEFKSNAPLIMNCLTGSERSGLIALAICTILATQTKRPVLINVVDVWYRICSQRKAALRDTNNLELSMQIVLSHAHDLLNKRGIMTSYQMKNAQVVTAIEKEEIKDPLNDLDPLWKLKQK